MRVVEARGLIKVYGEGEARVVALDPASLVVGRSEFMAIMGPPSSGKSTLLHYLADLDTPTSDDVLITGQDLPGIKDEWLIAVRRGRLGFIFQSFNLLPTLSAEKSIPLPQRLVHRRSQRGWYGVVISTLGTGDRLSHRPHELSGGQQQHVVVARALVSRPGIVFIDEPTDALDTASAANLLQTLAHMYQTLGQAIVMVTHDEQATITTNHIIRLRDRRIIRVGAVCHPAGTRTTGSGTHRTAVPSPVTDPTPWTEVHRCPRYSIYGEPPPSSWPWP